VNDPPRTDRFLGWRLSAADRAALLQRFAPRYGDLIADHVTLGLAEGDTRPLEHRRGEVVGYVDDGEGLEALVVSIGGDTRRPDGSAYHITWSLDRIRGRRPVQSNDVIACLGWTPVQPPVPVNLEPAAWPD
jgi:hypothetical protein